MALKPLEIFCYYDQQRFIQFGSMDCANWYGVIAEHGKMQQALYPAMGRKHINFLGSNRLIFVDQPRFIFRSIDYFYVVVGQQVYQYNQYYTQKILGNVSPVGDIWAAYLPVGTLVYVMLTDSVNIWLITEDGSTTTMELVTDANAPTNPAYVASFGNRFVVSQANTPDYYLTQVNVSGGAAACFQFGTTPNYYPLTNRATGIVRQFGVLHNQLYIFSDYSTDVWSNIPTQVTVTIAMVATLIEFPWKLNTSYNWDYGIADPHSLDIDFGMMVWLAQNRNGLVTFMSSNGQQPAAISTQAINVLLQEQPADGSLNPFLVGRVNGFLYQYEDSIFYRAFANESVVINNTDFDQDTNCLEYNFDAKTWHRCIEYDSTPNRILDHIYFNDTHIVTLQNDFAMYQMAGNIYYNEDYEPFNGTFNQYPMRYELVTPQIFEMGYTEFITNYIQIDFVFGNQDFFKSDAAFENTVYLLADVVQPSPPAPQLPIPYLVDETGDNYLIAEGSNIPDFDSQHYYGLYKPHIELYVSDDGGETFSSADNREFSQLGQYRWIMRWNELGTSRNRVYKLICVSSAPIVILGAVQDVVPSSGGGN